MIYNNDYDDQDAYDKILLILIFSSKKKAFFPEYLSVCIRLNTIHVFVWKKEERKMEEVRGEEQR